MLTVSLSLSLSLSIITVGSVHPRVAERPVWHTDVCAVIRLRIKVIVVGWWGWGWYWSHHHHIRLLLLGRQIFLCSRHC